MMNAKLFYCLFVGCFSSMICTDKERKINRKDLDDWRCMKRWYTYTEKSNVNSECKGSWRILVEFLHQWKGIINIDDEMLMAESWDLQNLVTQVQKKPKIRTGKERQKPFIHDKWRKVLKKNWNIS